MTLVHDLHLIDSNRHQKPNCIDVIFEMKSTNGNKNVMTPREGDGNIFKMSREYNLYFVRHYRTYVLPLPMGLLPDSAHAQGMTGTFSPPPRVSDPDMHHGTCVTHVPWCMSWSLLLVSFEVGRRGKHSRHSRRMRNFTYLVRGPLQRYLLHAIT